MGKSLQGFKDTCVIYLSKEDNCWVAHGLDTDQIGTGECIVDALVDWMKAINGLLELASTEPDIAVFRKAPVHIMKIAQKAKKLPRELYEIAHWRVHGKWPEEFDLNVKPHKKTQCYKVRVGRDLILS